MHDIYILLINAIRCSMTGKSFSVPEDIQWPTFVQLCNAHSVAPLVYDGLQKADLMESVPEDMKKLLSNSYMTAIFRDS